MDRPSRVLAAGAALAAGRDRGTLDRGSLPRSPSRGGQEAAARFGLDAVAEGRLGLWLATMAMEGLMLALFVPCGLPLPAPDSDPGRSDAGGSGGSATGAAPGPRASRSAR